MKTDTKRPSKRTLSSVFHGAFCASNSCAVLFCRVDLGIHQYKLTYSELLLTNPQYVETFQYQGRGFHEELTNGLEKIIKWQKVDFGFNIAVGYRFGQRK